ARRSAFRSRPRGLSSTGLGLPCQGTCRVLRQWLHVAKLLEIGMLALFRTIDLALSIYWWFIIAAAIFSWLYAFNVVNPRNQFVGMVGNFLFRVTEPALRP